jgi:serine/threonine-protein kinase
MPVAPPPYQASSAQAEEEEEGATTAPSMAPLESRPGRAAPKRPPARARTKTPVEPAAVEAQEEARGEKSGWMGKLVLLLILAGLGGLLYLEPVRAMFKPGYESAVAWVKTELELTPPPPPEEKPWPPPPPPGRPQNPLAQAEPTPAPEAPAEAEPAEPLEPSEKLSATATKPSTSKPGTSRPKPEPSRPVAGTPSPTGAPPKPQNLEAQVAASPQTTLEVDPSGEAEVVDTSSPKALRKAGMGLLTLATVPPAAVFEGQTSLGTTPLRKVPLLAGTYRLRIVDSDGVSRLFSAPVELAKEKKYTIRVSDLPLYPE